MAGLLKLVIGSHAYKVHLICTKLTKPKLDQRQVEPVSRQLPATVTFLRSSLYFRISMCPFLVRKVSSYLVRQQMRPAPPEDEREIMGRSPRDVSFSRR